MNFKKKAFGLLALTMLAFGLSACSTADNGCGSSGNAVSNCPAPGNGGNGGNAVPPLAEDANGNAAPLTLSPSSVHASGTGQPTTSQLTWAVQGANQCTASGNTAGGNWTGNQPTTGSVTVGPYTSAGTYTYVLSCTSDSGGVLSQTATLTVNDTPTPVGVSLTGHSATAKPGESVALSWSTSGSAAACTASSTPAVSGWSGTSQPTTSPTSGAWLSLPTAGNYVFTLTCSADDGSSASDSYAVSVGDTQTSAPPLLSITANPGSVAQGSSSSIEWETANATSCTASSNETVDNWNGSSRPVNDYSSTSSPTTFSTASTLPDGTYQYGLTCSGPGGNVARNATLVVGTGGGNAVPTLSFTVSATTTPGDQTAIDIDAGQNAYLTWTSTNAASCQATGGSWAPSAQPTTATSLMQGPFNNPGSYSFALNCSNPSGNSDAKVVTVNVARTGPTVLFSAQPNPVTQGSLANLEWMTSSDATDCTAVSGPTQDTGWTGSVGTSGNYAIPSSVYDAPGDYTYTLRCTGPTGITEIPVTFTVNPSSPGGPQFSSALTATPTSLSSNGGVTTLTWETTGADSCTASSSPALADWSGNQATSDTTGTSVTLPANTGADDLHYTLQLMCTNTAGSMTSAVDVVVARPVPTLTPVKGQSVAGLFVTGTAGSTDSVAVSSPTGTAPSVAPGSTLYFSWGSANTTACTASSNEPVPSPEPAPPSWASAVIGTSGDDVQATASTVPGYYDYTISCVGDNEPPAESTVTVLVMSSTASFCPSTPNASGVSVNSLALLTDNSSTPSYGATGDTGGLCIGCLVTNPTYATDAPGATTLPGTLYPGGFTNWAAMTTTVSALITDSVTTTINDVSTPLAVYPAGRVVNVGLRVPDSLLAAEVLGSVNVETIRNGATVDTLSGSAITLQLLGLVGTGADGYATLATTGEFDGVRVTLNGVVGAASEVDVRMACVSLQ